MAERKVLKTTGLLATFGITVKDREVSRESSFDACKDFPSFKAYVASLSDKAPAEGEASPLENVYNLYLYAADLKARAAAREAVAVESTIIKRDGKDIDLMKLPVEKAIGAVNAMYTLAASTGGEPQNAFVATRRKLIENKVATDKDGLLVKA